jgi:putative phage-type endonuclease
MAAVLLMTPEEVERDRDRWQKTRRGADVGGAVTASEIASILGIAPGTHSSAFELFHTKQMGREFQPDNEAMAWGRFTEPYVADRFAADHDYLAILPGGLYCAGGRPWQMATFDRLAVDLNRSGYTQDEALRLEPALRWPSAHAMPVQIKTSATTDEWGEPGSRDMPAHYLAQVIWEMDVADSETAWVPVMFPPHRVVTYIVRRDADVQQDIELMREKAQEFRERLQRDDPPPIDWTEATARALKAIHPDIREGSVRIPIGLAKKYRRARISRETSKRRLKLIENQIRGRMINAAYAVAVDAQGVEHKVLTRRQYSRETINSGLLRQAHPDIAKEVTRSVIVDALYPGGGYK